MIVREDRQQLYLPDSAEDKQENYSRNRTSQIGLGSPDENGAWKMTIGEQEHKVYGVKTTLNADMETKRCL